MIDANSSWVSSSSLFLERGFETRWFGENKEEGEGAQKIKANELIPDFFRTIFFSLERYNLKKNQAIVFGAPNFAKRAADRRLTQAI